MQYHTQAAATCLARFLRSQGSGRKLAPFSKLRHASWRVCDGTKGLGDLTVFAALACAADPPELVPSPTVRLRAVEPNEQAQASRASRQML